MSEIFGEQRCSINDGDTEIVLQHSLISPNFRSVEIAHESCLTGAVTYSKLNNYYSVQVTEHLFKSAHPNLIANQLLLMEGKNVTFVFASDGGLVQIMHLEKVDIFPLFKPYAQDVAVLTLVNKNFIVMSGRLRTRSRALLKTSSGKYIRSRGIIL